MRLATLATVLLVASGTGARLSAAQPADGRIADWPYYAGDAGGSRYSVLTQLNKRNVTGLEIAWEYHTGDVSDGTGDRPKSEFETTPIVSDGTMYFTTPFNRVVALDPETGKEKWSFDPKIDLRARYSEGLVNRGVRCGPIPAEAAAMPAIGASFWQPSTRAFSPSMLRRVCPAPISVLLARST